MSSDEMQFPEGFEFPQSYEVAEQRVKDLADYVWARMPELFELPDEESGGVAQVGVSRDTLRKVLNELEDEFGHSHINRISLLGVVGGVLCEAVRPFLDEAAMKAYSESGWSEESEEAPNAPVTLDVLWHELFPVFNPESQSGVLLSLAGLGMTGLLNSMLWEDPAWDYVLDSLEDSVPHLFEGFYGALGFHAICAFIRVTKFRELPNIAYHMDE